MDRLGRSEWPAPVRRIELESTPRELAGRMESENLMVLDRRDDDGVSPRPIFPGRINLPYGSCQDATGELPRDREIAASAAEERSGSPPRSSSGRASSGSCTSPTAVSAPGSGNGRPSIAASYFFFVFSPDLPHGADPNQREREALSRMLDLDPRRCRWASRARDEEK